jgi:hypothetical protein
VQAKEKKEKKKKKKKKKGVGSLACKEFLRCTDEMNVNIYLSRRADAVLMKSHPVEDVLLYRVTVHARSGRRWGEIVWGASEPIRLHHLVTEQHVMHL